MRVMVKNTFIDVSSPELVELQLHHKGERTCQARLSEPDAKLLLDNDDSDEDVGHRRNQTWSGMAASPSEGGTSLRGYAETPMTIRGFQDMPFPDMSGEHGRHCMDPYMIATSSLNLIESFTSTPTGMPAPPCYYAPLAFQEKEMLPPPSSAPAMGRQVLQAAFSSLDSPTRTPSADDAKKVVMTVKNTFIDMEDEDGDAPYDDRYSMSCTARFSGPVPAIFPPTPEAGRCFASASGSMLQPRSPMPSQAPPLEQKSIRPSVGSEMHGQIEADGGPACQPCAWFYKDSGCTNELACRYCHLCPQGELKNRKKLKIARLRSQDPTSPAQQDA